MFPLLFPICSQVTTAATYCVYSLVPTAIPPPPPACGHAQHPRGPGCGSPTPVSASALASPRNGPPAKPRKPAISNGGGGFATGCCKTARTVRSAAAPQYRSNSAIDLNPAFRHSFSSEGKRSLDSTRTPETHPIVSRRLKTVVGPWRLERQTSTVSR